jgi:hypothetical protein
MENPRSLASFYFSLKIVALAYKYAYSLFSRVCTKNPKLLSTDRITLDPQILLRESIATSIEL